MTLNEVSADRGSLHPIYKFSEVQPGHIYFLKRYGDELYGFAEAEDRVQTHDCVASITNGDIDDFIAFKDGEVEYESDIYPPTSIDLPTKVNSPMRLDAVIFNEYGALVLQYKHNLKLRDVLLFQKKVNIIRQYSTEPWFLQARKDKLNECYITSAMCSSTPINNDILKYSALNNIKFVVRQGLKYIC